MEMPAGLLPRGAAGMKHMGTRRRRQARNLPVLKSGCRQRRNLCPPFDFFWRCSPGLAKTAINRVVLELKCKKLVSQLLEAPPAIVQWLGSLGAGRGRRTLSGAIDKPTQTRSKLLETGLFAHAVFILPGWFSATAWTQYVLPSCPCRKPVHFPWLTNPSSPLTSANAWIACSRSSRECAAEICVRIRAFPFGTTG
jgi:hypothetical protein